MEYLWDFGDGGRASGINTSHVFGHPGTYLITLTVVDDGGATSTASQSLAVLEPRPPVAVAAYSPSRPAVGALVTFDGTNSLDPDGSVRAYFWEFGDGAVGQGLRVTHAYDHSGSYKVELKVIDEDALTGADEVTIRVVSVPITDYAFWPTQPTVAQNATFWAFGTYDEAGVRDYVWSFGDGTYGRGWQVGHVYSNAGTYRVTLYATNVFGITSNSAKDISVVRGRATGQVVSAEGQPLQGAKVSTTLGGVITQEVYSDADGRFEIHFDREGIYEVELARAGFVTLKFSLVWAGGVMDLGKQFLEEQRPWPGLALPSVEIMVAVGMVAATALFSTLLLRGRRRSSKKPSR